MMMMYGYGYGFYMMGFNVLFFLVTLGLILWLIRGNEPAGRTSMSPEEILKRRLAWGEIDQKEFERLRDIIRAG